MASSGPLYPGTTASLANAGTSENANAWTSPANIGADDATEASITAATYDSPDISELLVASNFGFALPSGATILGITVEIDRRSIIAGSGADFRVQLAKGTTFASLVGTNKAATGTTWPSSSTVATYGGSADLWGATWSDTDINASSFAVMLSASAKIANADIGVDFIRVTVDYTAPVVRTTTDGLGMSDTVTRVGSFLRTVADALGLGDVATQSKSGGSLTTYVDDDFEARSPSTDTWGSAPTGGDYTGDGTATDITSGRGTMTHTAAANTVARLLSATTAQDVELTAVVQTDKVPTGAEVQIRVGLRMLDTANYYRIGFFPQTNGDVALDAHPFVASVAGTSFINTTLTGFGWSAGTDYAIKVQAEGVSPTTVRVKIWDASGSEPGTWSATGTDSEATLQTSGAYAIIFRTTSSVTNFPILASWAWWKVTSIPAAGGGSLARTVTDALGLAESLGRTFVGLRVTTDGLTLADVPARLATLLRSTTDSITRADVATATRTYLRSAADAIGLADATTRALSAVRSATDSLTLGDVASRVKGAVRTTVDSITRSDVAVGSKTFVRSVADAIGLADAASRSVALVRAATDAITRSDAATRSLAAVRATTDTISRSDAATRLVGLVRAASDSLTLADAATALKVYLRFATDALGLADSASRVAALGRSVSDSITRADVATRAVTLLRSVADSITRSDVATGSRTYLRAVADALGLSDAATRSVGAVRSVTDSLTRADTVATTRALVRVVADSIARSDAVTRAVSAVRTATDALGLADSAVRSIITSGVNVVGGLPPVALAVRLVSRARGFRDRPGGSADHPKPGG